MGTFKLLLGLLLFAFAQMSLEQYQAAAQDVFDQADIIVSDDFAEINLPNHWDYDPAVVPTQLRQGAAGRGRTAASPAALSGPGQRTPQNFTVRLARAPNMMGDFFGIPGQTGVVGELFTAGGLINGLAVYQASTSASAFANDNIALIVTDPGTLKTVFLGGPGGLTPGTFFEPSIPPAQLQNPQPGLRLDGDNVNFYTAVLNGEVVNVFDNPADIAPSIPGAPVYQIFQTSEINLPSANLADIAGRVRVQDNNSTLPRDRVFLDYNYFHNVPFTANGIDVNRFTPGVEKTFWNGMGSLEVRVPLAVTFNSTQSLATGPDASEPELGNITLISKFLLTSNDEMALAAGMAVALPTADDYHLFGQTGAQILEFQNDSVHLIPFLAFLCTPTRSDYFSQVFITADVDTNGNPVFGDVGSGDLEEIGNFNDQTLLTGSAAFGKFVYQSSSRSSRVQSVALVSEFHYTATVSDADVIRSGPFQLGNQQRDIAVLNATFGGNVRMRDCSVTTGYTVPLTSTDRIFDGELRVFLNRFF